MQPMVFDDNARGHAADSLQFDRIHQCARTHSSAALARRAYCMLLMIMLFVVDVPGRVDVHIRSYQVLYYSSKPIITCSV